MRISWFKKEEWQDFWIVAFVFAFMLSFNEWGSVNFSFGAGIKNLIIAFLITTMSLFVHHFGQRWYAAKEGIQAEQRVWWYGLIIGLIIVIFSNGAVKIFAATALFLQHVPTARVGRWFYQTRTSTIGLVAFMGPLFNILLAAIAIGIKAWIAPGWLLADKIVAFNVAFALFSMIPIPPLDGSRVFFSSRAFYAFSFGAVAGYVALSQLFKIYTIWWSLAIGAAFWLIFYFAFEKGAWKWP
jgi:Zn-dependent protease